MTDAPDRIYLEPWCCHDDSVGQLWCENANPHQCDHATPWTPYMRADLVQAQLAQAREQNFTWAAAVDELKLELRQAREQVAKLLAALKDARDSLEIIGMPDELEDLNVAAIDTIIAESEPPPSNPAESDV